jgi:hypothetical protein
MKVLSLKKQQEQELVLSVLNTLWDANNKHPFKISIINAKLSELKIDRALSSHMVNCGYLKKLQRGVCRFKYKPSKLWVEKIFIERYEQRELYYSQKKTKSIDLPSSNNDLNHTENDSYEQLEPNNIEHSILLLKSLGYRILKPIEPQYIEI